MLTTRLTMMVVFAPPDLAFPVAHIGGVSKSKLAHQTPNTHDPCELTYSREAETAYCMKGRYQLANFAKFNRLDPMRDWDWENPSSINLYQYVRNNPIDSWDPTGLFDPRLLTKSGRQQIWNEAKQSLAFIAGAANAVGSNNLLGAGRMNPSDLPPEVQTSARVGQVVGDIFSIGQGFIEGAAGASLTGTAMAGSPLAVAASGPTMGGSAAVDAGMGLVGIGVMVHAATVVVTAAVNGADNVIALSEGSSSGGTNSGGKVEGKVSNGGSDGNGEGGKVEGRTQHGNQRAEEAQAGDPNRQVGDPNRVVQNGRRFTDSETGNTVYVKGDKVVVVNEKGQEVTRFKNSRKNTLRRIRDGRWVESPKEEAK